MRALLVVSLAVGLSVVARGQAVLSRPHAVTARAVAKAVEPAETRLRVTHVSLYKNGVGFFEHAGSVVGDEAVRLDLTSAQLNDVLQTLTAADLGGGHIVGANYNSTTPLEQQLRTLPLSLGEQPSQEELYRALRGARVEVMGSGATFAGRLLSLETRAPEQTADDEAKTAAERKFLTVVADSGATRTVELTPSTVVRVLDAGLRSDLNGYLALLDRNRSEGVRHLTLMDRGAGVREVRVSFLSEVPVWKSTYRMLLTGGTAGKSVTVQGFSVVDNTTGEDWDGVQLSLIAGNPQSFLQPLSQPIYDRRPEIPIAQNEQFVPQTHASAMDAVEAANSASASLSSAAGGNPSSLFGSPTGTGSGIAGPDVTIRAPSRIPKNMNLMKDMGPPPPPMPYETIARASTEAKTTTAAFDDFFAYTLTDPVTIPRNGSALVPILQAQLPVESVTLWSPAEPRALRALRVTNSSELTLDRGSFAVVEDGAFAGQGLIEPVHPGERRLLSYAVDDAVRVMQGARQDTRRISAVAVSKGVLRAANTEVEDEEYTLTNAAAEGRTVIVEEPRRVGWSLDGQTKAAETTPDAFRFRVAVGAHGSAKLAIRQRHVTDQYFRLVDNTEEQLTVYLRDNRADLKVLSALEPVFAAKRALTGVDVQMSEVEAKIATIGEEQKRLRENMVALKGSAEERALVRRYTAELNAQEDTLDSLQRELGGLRGRREAAAAELVKRMESREIEGDV